MSQKRARSVSATTRPKVSAFAVAPIGDPHLTNSDVALVEVPGDGLCLYHCVVAAQPCEWLGMETRQADVERAQDVRRRVIQNARSCGKHETGERLAQQGQAGWAGDSELKYINDIIGGSILLQEGSLQTVASEGPLKMHINVQKVTDGAGHESAHFSIFQSWMGPPQDAVAVSLPVACLPASCRSSHLLHQKVRP